MIIQNDVYVLEMASCIDNIILVENLVAEIIEEYKVNEDVQGNIIISLTEAVTNAILHGNNNDSTKKVILCFYYKDNKLCFTIKDEGKGFCCEKIPDPTAPENLTKLSGRGVYIIKQLADEVIFDNNGADVTCIFYNH